MHFANPSRPRQIGQNGGPIEDQQNFELSQYTPMGIQHFSAQYKNDPKALEKLSKRISARVEQDSSDLITFCDKKIRKRRKKKRLEEEERKKNGQDPLTEDFPPAPEVVSASDLLVGACLGQGSFSSVFILEKHLHVKGPATGPRRGRRSRLSRPGMGGTNQGSGHNRSMSNHNSILPPDDSTSNRSSVRVGRSNSPTKSLRRRLRNPITSSKNNTDESNRSRSNNSRRSRTMSPTRNRSETAKNCPTRTRSQSQKNYIPMAASSNHQRGEVESSSPVKIPRSPTKTRTRSLSASIQRGIRAVFGGNNSTSNHQSIQDEEEFEVPLEPCKTFARKSKSHHIRPQHEEENSTNGRGIFQGGRRSLSLHKRRRSRRSRSRGDENENNRGRSVGDDNSRSTRTGVLFNSDDSGSGNSNLVVKILQPKLMNQPKLFANCAAGLIREGLFLAAIDHPNVLKVHAWTSPNGWMDFANLSRKEGDLYDGYILVLERLQGGSLKRWMRIWQSEAEEERKALAAVAAMEAAEEKKRQERSRRMGLQRTLSFTDSSQESNSISIDNSNHLRHTVLTNSTPQSPSDSSHSYYSGNSDRSFPYTGSWPTTKLADRASLLMQLSDTVKYLHKHRILHRDLKPDNLGVTFVDPRSNYLKSKQYPSSLSLKVFDFDIARLVPEEPKEGKKKKKHGSNGAGSIASFDPEILNSNRSGRSMSPIRTSNSLSGEDPATRKRTKKYRGKRPDPTTNPGEVSPIPTVISASLEEAEAPPQGDALFEMTAKMGSPRYMAPEIARGEPYNLRSEVYTVCLLVHEVLTLQKPYDELAPEDHSKLVHFDLPGYRPPIFSDWNWPAELEEVLHLGWGTIGHRPSMKDVHSVLKKTLPKLCPELNQIRAAAPLEDATQRSAITESMMTTTLTNSKIRHTIEVSKPPTNKVESSEHNKKGRSIFHRSHHKRSKSKQKRSTLSSSLLTPTASNSDISYSNDEPRLAVKKMVQ